MVAVLQKKKEKKEKESMMKKIDDNEDVEGDNIPHQIKGNVNGFSQIMLK